MDLRQIMDLLIFNLAGSIPLWPTAPSWSANALSIEKLKKLAIKTIVNFQFNIGWLKLMGLKLPNRVKCDQNQHNFNCIFLNK